MYCQSCGKELTPGAAFCASCGARVGANPPVDYWWGGRRRWKGTHESNPWRDREPADAAWGAVRAVGFLVVIGLTIAYYPDVFVLFFRYLGSWGAYGYPVLPPRALGEVIIFLFMAGGVWGIVSAAARLALSSHLRKAMHDVVGGAFSVYLAFVLTRFYAEMIRGAGLALLFFLGLAAVVLIDAIIGHFVPRRGKTRRAAAIQAAPIEQASKREGGAP